MIMYDRQTESWWQQFEGRAIVGEFAKTDSVLETIPSPWRVGEPSRSAVCPGRKSCSSGDHGAGRTERIRMKDTIRFRGRGCIKAI